MPGCGYRCLGAVNGVNVSGFCCAGDRGLLMCEEEGGDLAHTRVCKRYPTSCSVHIYIIPPLHPYAHRTATIVLLMAQEAEHSVFCSWLDTQGDSASATAILLLPPSPAAALLMLLLSVRISQEEKGR